MTGLGFDPFNPPQLSREDRAVAGCSCGGLNWHATECSIWVLDRAQAQEAIADAEKRVRAHTDMLNAALSQWQGAHSG